MGVVGAYQGAVERCLDHHSTRVPTHGEHLDDLVLLVGAGHLFGVGTQHDVRGQDLVRSAVLRLAVLCRAVFRRAVFRRAVFRRAVFRRAVFRSAVLRLVVVPVSVLVVLLRGRLRRPALVELLLVLGQRVPALTQLVVPRDGRLLVDPHPVRLGQAVQVVLQRADVLGDQAAAQPVLAGAGEDVVVGTAQGLVQLLQVGGTTHRGAQRGRPQRRHEQGAGALGGAELLDDKLPAYGRRQLEPLEAVLGLLLGQLLGGDLVRAQTAVRRRDLLAAGVAALVRVVAVHDGAGPAAVFLHEGVEAGLGHDRLDVDRLTVGVQEQIRGCRAAVVAEAARLGRHVDAGHHQVALGDVAVAVVGALVPQPRQLVLEGVLIAQLVQQLALGVRIVGELLQGEGLVQGESAQVEGALRGGRQGPGLDGGADPGDVGAAGVSDLLFAQTQVEQHLVGVGLLDALEVLVVVVDLQHVQDELDVVVGVGDEGRQLEALGLDSRDAAPQPVDDGEVLDGLSVLDQVALGVDGREEPEGAHDQRGADAEQAHRGDQIAQVAELRALEALRLVQKAGVEQPGAERQRGAALAGVEVDRFVGDLTDQCWTGRHEVGAGGGVGLVGGVVGVLESLGVVGHRGHDGTTST
ncbi:pentapeptide repeat-containing protein [Paractinoplanes ferrugineus]|uniref:pentapeptide repeat-containing protein n=1 Tax=Paractinoplanes ferrugineus TaxID=113564 RepID=UPI0034DB2827